MGVKGAETANLIKNKAKRLFSCNGYKNVTMKDICDETGLSRGGLYRHFGSTHQIFSAILEDFARNQIEDFENKMKKQISALEILDELLHDLQKEMLDSENSLSLAIYEFSNEYRSTFMADMYEKSKYAWSGLIRYGIERKEFADVNVDEVTDLILFSYQGVRMWSRVMVLKEHTVENIINQIRKVLGVLYE